MEHIINLCKANGIHLTVSTFCHFLFNDMKNSPSHQKFHKGVIEENKIINELAQKHGIPLVDNFFMGPLDEKYFFDTMHFLPDGMKKIAANISVPIIEYIENWSK